MSKDIIVRIIEVLKKHIESNGNVDEITDHSKISDLGINSISFIKFVVALESEFDIEFEDDSLDFNGFETIRDIANYVEKKIV